MPRTDDDVIAELDRARGWHRVPLAAELGDSTGDTGPTRLRLLLEERGPGTSDLRCASILALAKRCQEHAHDDYVRAFDSQDDGTRSFAVFALSAFGRDGMWDRVADRLVRRLKRRHRREATIPDPVLMIIYLARHAAVADGRVTALVEILRAHWASLDPGDEPAYHDGCFYISTQQWLRDYWPDAAPDGPPLDSVTPPDVHEMELWIRTQPLLQGLAPRE